MTQGDHPEVNLFPQALIGQNNKVKQTKLPNTKQSNYSSQGEINRNRLIKPGPVVQAKLNHYINTLFAFVPNEPLRHPVEGNNETIDQQGEKDIERKECHMRKAGERRSVGEKITKNQHV